MSGSTLVHSELFGLACLLTLGAALAARRSGDALWRVAVGVAALGIVLSVSGVSVPLYSMHCGVRCGHGWDLEGVGIAVAVVLAAGITQLGHRRWRRSAWPLLAAGLVAWYVLE